MANQSSTRHSASKTGKQENESAQQRAEAAMGPAMTAAEAVQAAGGGLWKSSRAFNEEAAHFAARRAERYREYFEDLARCENPADAMQAASRAARSAMEDYMEEFGRMSELAMSNIEEMNAAADGSRRKKKQ